MAALHSKALEQLLPSDLPPAPLVEANVAPHLSHPSLSLPFLGSVFRSDWSGSLRPQFHFRRVSWSTPSEDALLTRAFSPQGLYPPKDEAFHVDWDLIRLHYLPAKTTDEIRNRFLNIRLMVVDHPLKKVRLLRGVRGNRGELTAEEAMMVRDGLAKYPTKPWHRLCQKEFPTWEKRALRRSDASPPLTPHTPVHCLVIAD